MSTDDCQPTLKSAAFQLHVFECFKKVSVCLCLDKRFGPVKKFLVNVLLVQDLTFNLPRHLDLRRLVYHVLKFLSLLFRG